nr:carbonic anhydrase=27 kda chloroplastic isoform subunit {N-terminal} {EC 4.2.1.1} [Solanum tuberosum=potatoes, cv. Kennebec, leaves, chloroplasts, Peptide Chloroplast Partial, 15 aa] [Solanum tuberosum]
SADGSKAFDPVEHMR